MLQVDWYNYNAFTMAAYLILSGKGQAIPDATLRTCVIPCSSSACSLRATSARVRAPDRSSAPTLAGEKHRATAVAEEFPIKAGGLHVRLSVHHKANVPHARLHVVRQQRRAACDVAQEAH
jgi:hypothetical protein